MGLKTHATAAGGVALAEPLVFNVEAEPVVQRFIEILDLTTGGRLITIVEFLSPSNKLPGDGHDQYKRKQMECRNGGVNLVEIDLTRTGRRELLAHAWVGARQYDSSYQASVWRAHHRGRCELYPMRLQDRLPAIRIPLRPTDDDAVLDIQSLVEGVYSTSRYDRTTDYKRPCTPPLEGDEAEWAKMLTMQA